MANELVKGALGGQESGQRLVKVFVHEIGNKLLISADEAVEQFDRKLFELKCVVFSEDVRQNLAGNVGAGLRVGYVNSVTGTNELIDLVESGVTAIGDVVKSSIRVFA